MNSQYEDDRILKYKCHFFTNGIFNITSKFKAIAVILGKLRTSIKFLVKKGLVLKKFEKILNFCYNSYETRNFSPYKPEKLTPYAPFLKLHSPPPKENHYENVANKSIRFEVPIILEIKVKIIPREQ